MYGLRNSELSTCLFQFSHKTRQTMLLYAYFTPKDDFKRKFNLLKSFLYEWRLTAWTIRKFQIGPSIWIESRIGGTIRNRIESRSFAGRPYNLYCVGADVKPCSINQSILLIHCNLADASLRQFFTLISLIGKKLWLQHTTIATKDWRENFMHSFDWEHSHIISCRHVTTEMCQHLKA